jgi:hypothetical protein
VKCRASKLKLFFFLISEDDLELTNQSDPILCNCEGQLRFIDARFARKHHDHVPIFLMIDQCRNVEGSLVAPITERVVNHIAIIFGDLLKFTLVRTDLLYDVRLDLVVRKQRDRKASILFARNQVGGHPNHLPV